MSQLSSSAPCWLFLESGAGAAAANMAWDEALLEASPVLGGPVLRHYAWLESAATFGYFQKCADVERMTVLRPLVRRPTGGGLVPHDADWTYSLAFPPADPWSGLKAVESYRQVHEWIQAAFARLGEATELASARRDEGPGQCFLGAEQSDLLLGGRKIAGAAQRRTRHGLLIQGSIHGPPGVERAAFEHAFREVASLRWGVTWQPLIPDTRIRDRVVELVREKYGNPGYNRRR